MVIEQTIHLINRKLEALVNQKLLRLQTAEFNQLPLYNNPPAELYQLKHTPAVKELFLNQHKALLRVRFTKADLGLYQIELFPKEELIMFQPM